VPGIESLQVINNGQPCRRSFLNPFIVFNPSSSGRQFSTPNDVLLQLFRSIPTEKAVSIHDSSSFQINGIALSVVPGQYSRGQVIVQHARWSVGIQNGVNVVVNAPRNHVAKEFFRLVMALRAHDEPNDFIGIVLPMIQIRQFVLHLIQDTKLFFIELPQILDMLQVVVTPSIGNLHFAAKLRAASGNGMGRTIRGGGFENGLWGVC